MADNPSERRLRWFERLRRIALPDGHVASVRVKLWTPPWVFHAAARRLRALESYHQLIEVIAANHPEAGGEFRRARARLDAQISLDAIGATERNTIVMAAATWALVLATLALVAATIALIVAG